MLDLFLKTGFGFHPIQRSNFLLQWVQMIYYFDGFYLQHLKVKCKDY